MRVLRGQENEAEGGILDGASHLRFQRVAGTETTHVDVGAGEHFADRTHDFGAERGGFVV